MGNHLNNYRKGMKRFLFLGLTLLGFIIPHTPAYSQPTKKVKIFLMAGQSNMQGFGTGEMLRKLLCAKEELELPEDPNECYGALPDVEDRIFEMIGDYYGNLQTYDDQNARLVAQLVNENELIDHRLLDPFDQVKAINFNYRRSNGVRSEPTIWSGPLKLGFGNSSSKETFGPELVFGHHIAQYIDEEIILLKVAEGGTDLYEKWRSPSMEARLGVSDEPTNYPLLVEHLTEVQTNISVHFPEYEGLQVETELAGFVWFQGWNDGILPVAPTYAPAYEENLTDLVTDLRNDLDMPDLPVLIAQSQNDDFYGTIIQQAQRAVADQIGNAQSFITTDLSNSFHYDPAAVLVIGDRMAAAMADLLREDESEATPLAPSDFSTTVQPGTVSLSWKDNSYNEDGFRIERSEHPETGFEEITTVSANTRSYTDSDLPKGTYYYRVSAYNGMGNSAYDTVSAVVDKLIPEPWKSIDIGNPPLAGSADYANGLFTVYGNGRGFVQRSDELHFVYQEVSGDGEIVAKVNSLVNSTGEHAVAGLMIRNELPSNSNHGMVALTNDAKIRFRSRGNRGSGTYNDEKDTNAQWIKLSKVDQMVSAYSSIDGTNWELFNEQQLNPFNDYHIGLVVTSNDDMSLAGAVFSEVFILSHEYAVPQAPSDLVATTASTETIMLNWTDNSGDELGFKVERSEVSGSGYQLIGEVAPGVTSYEDQGLNPSTTYFYRVRAFNEAGDSDYSEVASAQTQDGPGELPQGWTPIAIGEPVPDGTVDYNSSKESFSVSGTGAGVNGRSDAFYYVHQGTLTNGEIIAKVAVIQASAGIMIRQKLTDDSPHVTMIMDSSSVTNVKSRGHSGASTANYTSDNAPFQWFKLTKEGSVLKAFGSVDGQDWLFEKEYNISRLANDCYIGLMVSGNTSGVPSGEAVFSQVVVNAYAAIPAPLPPLQPVAIATSSSSITLNWTSNGSDVLGYKIERSASSEDGYEQVSEVAPGVTSYEDEGLNPATTYFYRVRAFNATGDSDYSEVASTQTQGESGALPAVWTNVDVGEPLVTGTATFENGNFLVSGAGEKVVGRKDEFHYVYQHWVRNGEIIAKVDSLSSTEQGQRAKAGLMIRESLSGSNTRMCFVSYNTNVNEEIVARSRDRQSGGTHQGASNPRTSLPFWLKLVKDGAYFTAYYKPDDTEDWILMYERIVTLDEVYAGLFVNSNNVASASDAVFSEVSVKQVFTPATPRALSVVVNEQNTMTSLTWEDYANGEEGFIIERSTDPASGYEVIDTLPPNSTTYIDDNPPLANVFYRVKSYDSNGTSQASNVDEVFIGELPGPWKNQEIGASITGGYAAFRDEKWFLNHKGSDTQHPSDHLQYLFQDLSGDGEVIARLADVTGPNNQSIAGMMIRESLDPESKMAFVGWNKDVNEYFLESRSTLGGGTSKVPHSTGAAPAWFRLNRTGDTFTGYYSVNGDNWVQVGQVVINMSDHVVIGAAVSNGGDNETLAVFTEITVNAFDPGIQVLHMPRLVGDSDQSNFPNVIDVHVTADTVGRRNTYTGMQGKTIGVTLAESVHSTYSTISLKFIPDSLNQSVDLLTAGDLVIRLDEDQVSATVGGQQLISESQISNIICNHVALRFSRQEIGLYVNGEWQIIENVTPFDINQLTLADYKGQTWDIQVHKGLLSNTAIEKISQLCVPSVDASEHSPYNELYTQAICGSYKCLWAKADVDLMQDRFIYHIYEQDIAFELFTFEAGMYVHGDIESILAYENGRNWLVTDDEKLIRGSFSNPMNSDGGSGHHWYHENFHGQQGFHPGEGYGGGKWLFEASANWGASYRYDYLPTGGFTGVTLYPHYAMTWDKTYDVPDGNRDYHHYILLSYITRFVSTPLFIGKLFNYQGISSNILRAFQEILAEEGHSFAEVFTEYAARTTVWDYQDGSGPVWKEIEEGAIAGWKDRGYENFNHKFSDIMDEAGTNGTMTPIPEDLLPSVYSWNAYKVASTSSGAYKIRLRGSAENPAGTIFKAKVIKGYNGVYEYFELPVSNQAAFGNQTAEITISTGEGEELYLVVASIPDEYGDPDPLRYRYEYSFERTSDTPGNAEQLTVYPNTTSGQLHIDLNLEGEATEPELRLFDFNGDNVAFNSSIEGSSAWLKFDGPAGLYLLKVITPNGVKTVRIIKE